ncbi:MAG: ABC transporter permease [Polyangiaceae bacterium]
MKPDRIAEALLPPLIALAISFVIGDLLIIGFGQSPGEVFRLLLEGTWGNAYGVGQVLYKATTLAFTGLSVAIALQAGLFNVGAEGQLTAGAFGAALVGIALPTGVPAAVAAPLCLLGAAVCGGLIGAIPGALRAWFGAHEVIVTVMMNFIVLAGLNWVVAAKLHDPETLHTPAIRAGALPRLSTLVPSLHGSAANVGVFVALGVIAIMLVVLLRGRFGFDLRAVGLSPDAARANGIRVGAVWIGALTLAGALAGAGGTNFVLGYKGYYEDAFAGGIGFMGIAVALVGRNHPIGVLLASLLFATLSQGGLAIHVLVPKQLVELLQAIVILAMASASPEARRLLAKLRAPIVRPS